MPKARFDRMGLRRDATFRVNNIRKLLLDLVTSARNSIYNHACSIGGTVINRMLKPTSSVLTMVISPF